VVATVRRLTLRRQVDSLRPRRGQWIPGIESRIRISRYRRFIIFAETTDQTRYGFSHFGIGNAFSGCALASVLKALAGDRSLSRARNGSQIVEVILLCEVDMQFLRSSTARSSSTVISGILNCVCPECGGRMGERGKEFRCQGECLTDWRQAWEQASAEIGSRSKRAARRI
jgi:hypothetical protein